jgi:hypothetical protein
MGSDQMGSDHGAFAPLGSLAPAMALAASTGVVAVIWFFNLCSSFGPLHGPWVRLSLMSRAVVRIDGWIDDQWLSYPVGVVNHHAVLFPHLHVILLDLVTPTSGRTDVSDHLGQRLRN